MKCVIPEISWHNRDPVLSVDIQPKRAGDLSDMYRLASGGSDSHVLIWYITHCEAGTINLEIAASLTRHQRPVNVVRWSPSGEYLASGDDESIIIVWKLKSESEPTNIFDPNSEADKEVWLTHKILRGHTEDVYDIGWSPSSQQLISGSVDNSAMVWDVVKGKSQAILRDHNSFVQGVAWDPQNHYLATLSTDRTFRMFDAHTKKVLSRSNKCSLPFPADAKLHGKVMRIFHDDTLQTFFRRLSFSPDGELIVTPSGVVDMGDAKTLHTTYIYTRYNTKQPAVILPSPDQYTVAVRFCPIRYKLHDHDANVPPVIALPYRMVFAVATKSSVYLYDTQQPTPIGIISNIHYTRLTDLAWSQDGRILVVSSTDGFCTLITFAADELGTGYGSDDEAKENVVPAQASKTADSETGPGVDAKSAGVDVRMKSDKIMAQTQVIVVKTPEKVIALEIPQGIISTKDKFDSPEITGNKPATPITFRRAPRNPDTDTKQSASIDVAATAKTDENPNEPIDVSGKSASVTTAAMPKSAKKSATPIAVRRHKRNILPDSAGPPIDQSNAADEAMDAWPIDQPRPATTTTTATTVPVSDEPTAIVAAADEAVCMPPPMDVDETEDIRLVYEDESQAADDPIGSATKSGNSENTPSAKTPRRVELRTISTPKAKKKLL